jgi:glycosyltransferase involved in cell wall biosynthesis
MNSQTRPVSVVVPTVGRPGPLQACLESVAACVPRADELLVVDQSGDASVREVVARFAPAGVRYVGCSGRGVSRGRNVGLANAAHDTVLVTDDDCTVAADWIGTAWELAARHPGTIITGRVLPVGEASAVPSWKDDPNAHDFTGEVHGGALFPNNMVLPRSSVLASGGFDERFGPDEAAEDNEFSYRWLREGRSLRYEPALVVWHHDWRTRVELERLYTRYARGQGFFYAKHLRRGDWTMLRFLARDLYWAGRGLVAAAMRRREDWVDPRRGIPRGLPQGLVHGWRVYGARGPRHTVERERDA